jgi:hypothetical protein
MRITAPNCGTLSLLESCYQPACSLYRENIRQHNTTVEQLHMQLSHLLRHCPSSSSSSSSNYILSHSINAIGPAPHQSGRKREHRSIVFATITHIPGQACTRYAEMLLDITRQTPLLPQRSSETKRNNLIAAAHLLQVPDLP